MELSGDFCRGYIPGIGTQLDSIWAIGHSSHRFIVRMLDSSIWQVVLAELLKGCGGLPGGTVWTF